MDRAAGAGERYFPATFCLRFARARRSVFFRRLARFLALSLPLLFPIIPNTLPLTSNIKSARRTDSSCGKIKILPRPSLSSLISRFSLRYARPARTRYSAAAPKKMRLTLPLVKLKMMPP